MKKKTSVVIGIIVVIIISMISGGIVVSGVLDPYEKQIKLGYKMISQEKYEEAILAFNKAIEIDQKKEKAYMGLADTYVARCDENAVNDANDALKRGYEQSSSEKIVQGYIDSAQKLYDKDKKDWAIELLEKGYEVTKDEKIRTKREEFIQLISFELLDKLYKYCESDNLDEVRKIMDSEEFIKVSAYATPDLPLLYSPNISKDNTSDKKVGIYISKSSKSNRTFLYFGDYKDNIRIGYGMWLIGIGNSSYVFKGDWENDKPNGYGISKGFYKDGSTWVMSGNLIDGLWNGECQEQYIDNKGDKVTYRDTVGIHFNNGIATVIEQEEGKDKKIVYIVGKGSAGDGDEVSMGYHEDEIEKTHGIDGFAEFRS